MPPSGRSSSSRSSRSSSRSISRSSSSRSSSSRSISRSRSSSSSSSSRPSRSSSNRSSYSSSISRPSSRSTTSRTSTYSYSQSKPSSQSPTQRSTTSHTSLTPKQKIAITFANNYKRPKRVMPSFVYKHSNLQPKYHHCYKHDYYYFNQDFYDSETNTQYKKGYYDENGTYYEDLKLEYSENEIIEMLTCEYCGSVEKIDLKNMSTNESLKCSNCMALLNMDNIAELNTDYYVCDDFGNFPNTPIVQTQQNTQPTTQYVITTEMEKRNSISSIIIIIFGVIISYCTFGLFKSILNNDFAPTNTNNDYVYDNEYENNTNNNTVDINDDYNNSYGYTDYDTFGHRVYVPEIDRICYYDGEYYYDGETNCYFWYNEDMVPSVFQYWYEDYSSQYGDYGWLEYDELEQSWYVEVDYDNWQKVDNPPSYFWHTTYDSINNNNNFIVDNEINDVELGDTIYVSAIDRECEFDGEYYYDVDSDCYFYYNDEVIPNVMQYWYEEFSSQYGEFGWIEYDELEQTWYVETSYGDWQKVDNPPSYFWHTTYEQLLEDNK